MSSMSFRLFNHPARQTKKLLVFKFDVVRYMSVIGHSHTRCAGMGWDVCCVATLCVLMYMNIHMYENGRR